MYGLYPRVCKYLSLDHDEQVKTVETRTIKSKTEPLKNDQKSPIGEFLK